VIAIALAFGASVAWGFSDFLGGMRAKRIAITGVVGMTLVGGILMAGLGVALGAGPWPGFVPLWPAIVSGLGSLLAFGTLYKALSIGPMSVVAPISATYPIVPVLVGLVFWSERPTSLQVAGMALTITGVLLAASEGNHKRGRTRIGRLGVVLAILSALGSGVMLTALDAAAKADPYWALLAARCVSVLVLLTVVAALRPTFGVRGLDVPALIGIGILDTGATGLFAVASTRGYLSVVSVVASLFPIMTVILAHVLLHERLRAHQWLGVAGALSGVVLITIG